MENPILGRLSQRGSHVVCLLLCLWCPLLWSGQNNGDDPFDLTLEEIGKLPVQSIDFFETSLNRAPNNLTVIGHHELERRPIQTLEKHIQFAVPGATMVRHGINGPNFGSRGLARGGSIKTLALWDGRALNGRSAFGYQAGYLTPFFGDLEQVEIVLGPGSLIHGTGAFQGFVNYVPKSGHNHQGLTSNLTFGLNDGLTRWEYGYGNRYAEDSSLFFYGGFAVADGTDIDNDFGGDFPRDSLEGSGKVGEILPSFRLSGNVKHDRFQLTGLFERLLTDVNTVLPDGFRKPQRETHIMTVQPRYTVEVGDSSSIEISPSFLLLDDSIRRTTRFVSDRAENPDVEDGGSESSFQLRTTFQTRKWEKHRISAGSVVDWRSLRPKQQYFSSNADDDVRNVSGKWKEYALFLEAQSQLTEKLQTSVGLRYDRTSYNTFTGQSAGSSAIVFNPTNLSNITPRLTLNYDLIPDHQLKLSYQEGFQYPTLEAYTYIVSLNRFLTSIGEQPFRSMEPDDVESIELGYSGQFKQDSIGLDISVFHNTFNDPLNYRNLLNEPFFLSPRVRAQLPNNLSELVFNTGGSYSTVGGEINLHWLPKTGVQLKLGYAYAVPGRLSERQNSITNLANESRNEYLIYPKHQLKGSIDYSTKRWSFNTNVLYQSGVDNLRPELSDNIWSDAHVRVNVGARYQLTDKLSLGLNVSNLFGNTAPSTTTTTQPYFGTLGSDQRLWYLSMKWQPK